MDARPLETNSAITRAKLGLCTGPLDTVFAALWAHPRPEAMALSYLVLLHQIMRASVPLMECAVARCAEMAESDPVAKGIAPYYRRHIDEERDHDRWALDDFAAAGFDPARVVSMTPPPEIAQFAGAQYYWILHHHPIMLMGYIAVLEAFPPTGAQIDRIRDDSGIPDDAFRTLRMHGELDPTHAREIDEALDALPLKQDHLDMIGLSIFHACEALAASVRALRPIELRTLQPET